MNEKDKKSLEDLFFRDCSKDALSELFSTNEELPNGLSGWNSRLLLAAGLLRARNFMEEKRVLISFLDGYRMWHERRNRSQNPEMMRRQRVSLYIDVWKAAQILDYDMTQSENDYHNMLPPLENILRLEDLYLRSVQELKIRRDANRMVDDAKFALKNIAAGQYPDAKGRLKNYENLLQISLATMSTAKNMPDLIEILGYLDQILDGKGKKYLYNVAKSLDWPQSATLVDTENVLPPGREMRFLDSYFYMQNPTLENVLEKCEIAIMQ